MTSFGEGGKCLARMMTDGAPDVDPARGFGFPHAKASPALIKPKPTKRGSLKARFPRTLRCLAPHSGWRTH